VDPRIAGQILMMVAFAGLLALMVCGIRTGRWFR
jgi:hypothetical protein